ncbi:MAG TPA: hypothetical protein VNS63_19030 [Blastocatellia bacterium]|nr:hypothetical protein [Blastocatellia bacterium]
MYKLAVRIAPSLVLACAMSLAALPPSAHSAQKTRARRVSAPTIWHDPGDVESMDFAAGPGGVKKTPKPPFTFVEEDTGGTNPKIKVKDAAGRTWSVKWGSEVHGEVFASRMAWAAGYYVEPTYFLESGKITGASGLHRAKKYVSSNGSFTEARFELRQKGIDKLQDDKSWSWNKNPFVGTKELDGLKIVIMLVSNWDPKDQGDGSSNTAIFKDRNTGETRYVVTDWGASMGKWGGVLSREKWDCDGYASQTKKFITESKRGIVEFGYDGKHKSEMREGISVSDVAWLLNTLGRVRDDQLRDGLKASGATEAEVSCFTSAIRDRINQLKNATANR